MKLIDWTLLSFASSLLVLFQNYSFSKLINEKIKISFKNILVLIFSGIIVTLNTYNVQSTLRAFISFAIIITAEYVIFRKNILDTFIYGSFCYIMVCITEILLSIIVINFDLINLQVIDHNVKYKILLSMLMTLPTCIITSSKYIQKLAKSILNIFKKSFVMILAIFSLFVITVIIEFRNVKNISYTAYIGSIIVLLIFIFLFLLVLNNKRKILKEIEKTKILLDFMNDYEKRIDEDRINRHEMLNNLLILKSYKNKNSEEFNNTLDELIKLYNSKKVGIRNIYKLPSGLKGIIYFKLNEINKKNVKVNINISKQLSNNLEKIDNKTYTMICKIVGIVFDNAIEATLSSKKKQLLFDVYEENNDIIIDIENSFNNTVYIEKISNKNYSTKGKNRGLGLYIVKKMINSNKKLSLEQKIDKDIFITKLCIKNLAEKLS